MITIKKLSLGYTDVCIVSHASNNIYIYIIVANLTYKNDAMMVAKTKRKNWTSQVSIRIENHVL